MVPRNPLNDLDVDGNTMAWMNGGYENEHTFDEVLIRETEDNRDC